MVIDYDFVKLRRKRQFVFSLINALFDNFWGVSATSLKSATQFFYRRWLYEYGECTMTIVFLDVASAYNIYIKHDMLSSFKLTLYLLLQGAIEAVGIYFLVFKELVVGDALSKFFGAEEEVFHTMLLGTAWGTARGRDGEG
jgi:hypothetical protein